MKFYVFVWSFFGVVFLASVFHWPLWPFHNHDPNFYSHLNEVVTIRGIIVDEPDQRENNTNLIILPTKINDKSFSTKEKLIARAPSYSTFQYGDEVEVRGKLELPEMIDSDNGRTFNYPEYLAKDNIYYLINRAEVKVISSGHGNIVKRNLFKIKHAFLSNLNELLPEPHSGFMGGLIIAGKKSLPADILAEFQRTGTLQIVVLSGYNITIVAEAMMKMFSFLPSAGGLIAGAGSIILFSIMAGGASTIVRAAVMALISILGKATHRVYDAKRALFMAGFLMVLQNPKILTYDPSFQLSFMATLGLMVLSPFFEQRLLWIPEKFQLRAMASATLASQVFVTPIIFYQIGQVSLVSVPTNMLMLILVPTIMLIGFITGLVGFVSHLVAMPFAFISYFLLSYELFVLKFFANIPFALISIPFPFWVLAGVYGFYVFIFFKRRKNTSQITKESAAVGGAFSRIKDIKILED